MVGEISAKINTPPCRKMSAKIVPNGPIIMRHEDDSCCEDGREKSRVQRENFAVIDRFKSAVSSGDWPALMDSDFAL